jgi:hypothetical protein
VLTVTWAELKKQQSRFSFRYNGGVPDSIPDEVGAQMLINTLTALTVIRTAHDSLPPDARTGVVVLLTGAGSAVGRLTAKVLAERGVKVISLVRSEASAARLTSVLSGSAVFATELAAWKDRVRAAAEGATIHVAIDSVGGRLLGDVADLLAERNRDRHQFRLTRRGDKRHPSICSPFPHAQRRGARHLDAAVTGAGQSRCCARAAARARARSSVRNCRTALAIADCRRRHACQSSRPGRRCSHRFLERLGGAS